MEMNAIWHHSTRYRGELNANNIQQSITVLEKM